MRGAHAQVCVPAHLTKTIWNLADLFEVAVIIGSCFIVNYVTADSKTNWAEGVSMISFYVIIVSIRSNFMSDKPSLTRVYEGSMCLVL